MIIIILGGVGSGKTLSAVKDIIDNNQFAITNFPLKNYKNYYRIKVSDIISVEKEGRMKKYKVNWKFWNELIKEHQNYSIYLDEVHNIIHSRRSMSHINIQMSKWVSQIRKMLMDKPTNHLFLISQTIRKIDVDFRELAQIIIRCTKLETKRGKVIMRQDFFSSLDAYLMSLPKFHRGFKPERYYRFYDRNELVTFEDAEDYL